MRFLDSKYSFIVILVLVVVLRCLFLSKGTSGDEIYTLKTVDTDLAHVFSVLSTRESHPPLTFYLLHLWRQIDGSEAWTRIYFVLFGVATGIVLYLIGAECVDRRFAMIAFLLSAFSPLLIWSAQYIRNYADSTFWILLCTFFLVRAIKEQNILRYWAGYIAAATLAVYTFYFAWFFIIAQFVYMFLISRARGIALRKIAAAQTAVFLLFSPLIALLFKQMTAVATAGGLNWSGKGFQIMGLRVGLYIRNIMALVGMDPYFLSRGADELLGNSLALGAVLFISLFFLAVTAFGFRCLKVLLQKQGPTAGLFLLCLLLPAVLAHLAGAFFNLLPNSRYLVVAHIFFIYFAAAVLYFLLNQGRKLVSTLFLAALLGLFLLRLPGAYAAEYDNKKAQAFIRAGYTAGDCIVLFDSEYLGLFEDGNILQLKQFFARDERTSEYLTLTGQKSGELLRSINSYRNIYLYLYAGNTKVFGGNELIRQWFEDNGYNMVAKRDFHNIAVLKYRK